MDPNGGFDNESYYDYGDEESWQPENDPCKHCRLCTPSTRKQSSNVEFFQILTTAPTTKTMDTMTRLMPIQDMVSTPREMRTRKMIIHKVNTAMMDIMMKNTMMTNMLMMAHTTKTIKNKIKGRMINGHRMTETKLTMGQVEIAFTPIPRIPMQECRQKNENIWEWILTLGALWRTWINQAFGRLAFDLFMGNVLLTHPL